MDRISKLPEPLLHHILSFCSQKKSVQTCVLSKSWRYLGPTRPNLVFLCEDYRYQKTRTLVSDLDNTLHRYHDQKLFVQEFHVQFRSYDPETVSFLEKWLPYLVANMGAAKTIDLSFGYTGSNYFDLPSEVFENSKSLVKLCLGGFRFSQNLPVDKINLEHLQTLTLKGVHIADEAFQNIMSSCRYIEHLHLSGCKGQTTIRLMNNTHLKRFDLWDFHFDHVYRKTEDLCLVDVPNLESMDIFRCGNYWFDIDRHRNMYFPGLKSLKLTGLRLPTRPSLDILSCDFPSLQDFYVHDCKGFGQLRVSNSSVKRLTLWSLDSPMKVVVDAPNLERLDYRSSSTLDISFATASDECVSKMAPHCDLGSEDGFLELRKLLEAVSQLSSKIHLVIPHNNMYDDWSDYSTSCGEEDDDDYDDYEDDDDDDDDDNNGGDGYDDYADYDHDICAAAGFGGYITKPVLVEYLDLDYEGHGYFYSMEFLNRMFRYFRPRNILELSCFTRSRFLCKKFVLKHNKGSPYYWQRDLEEASMELRDKKSKEWHSVEVTTFLESGCRSSRNYHDYYNKYHEAWFKLKWRE